MSRRVLSLAIIALVVVSGAVLAQPGPKKVNETLTGFEEVPALSTPGGGKFHAQIAKNGSMIAWELRYANLATTVTQAHIHFENETNNGPITVFLCTNLGNGPAGIQACPASPATITGVIEADDVSPDIPLTQLARDAGLGTGELAELIQALRAGALYVNVHTEARAGGEIRSQLHDHPGHHGHPH